MDVLSELNSIGKLTKKEEQLHDDVCDFGGGGYSDSYWQIPLRYPSPPQRGVKKLNAMSINRKFLQKMFFFCIFRNLKQRQMVHL